jgi:hypothetical protein
LTSGDPEVDVDRAQNALAKANNRLQAAAKEGQTAAKSS